MPVGTYGTVKGMTPQGLREVGAEIILSNTFHLMLRPGIEVIKAHQSLHTFSAWDGPILTDSGGFQVFSLSALRKITEAGVEFQSPVDGARIFMSPERSIEVQHALGSDIVMIFDECLQGAAQYTEAELSMQLSLRWAKRSHQAHQGHTAALFGIIQGGLFETLREQSLLGLLQLGFDGYAIGGLSVGESKEDMRRILTSIIPKIPMNVPRYLMGVGRPEDIVMAVDLGVDMFDCVIPTRHARNNQLFTGRGMIKIKNVKHRCCVAPIEIGCDCYTCVHF